ncbi:MAG: hypothetical protein ACKV2Q_36500 [Planctomycetaceae bacterium]
MSTAQRLNGRNPGKNTQAGRYYDRLFTGALSGISDDIAVEQIKPRRNTLLAKLIPPDGTRGGLVIPDVALRETGRAVVVAVPDQPDCPYAAGDVIIHRMAAGDALGIDGLEDFMLFNFAVRTDEIDPDILATIQKKGKKTA